MNQTEALNQAITGSIEESGWRSAYKKFTFLFFCWLSLLIVGTLEGVVFYLVQPRLSALSQPLAILVLSFLLFVFLILFSGLSLITITALTGIDLLYPHGKKSVTVNFLFPIAIFLAQLFRVNRNALRTSFVKVNNALTKAQSKRIKGDRILVLLPHCLQIDICNRKITNNINNCVRCGRCPVGELVAMGESHGLKIEVVNGGTLARRRVAEMRPDGIIAVACERDLTLGIQDVYPVPVFGVINDRPYGPCLNTCVDMSLVEEAVKFFQRK
ncbi:MAG: DUF116 domain-containing protein [Fibrobacter sp.]|jgi:hypothetical protein|nr:DUF116 domain-containing protein [Fibrobacter sp.]